MGGTLLGKASASVAPELHIDFTLSRWIMNVREQAMVIVLRISTNTVWEILLWDITFTYAVIPSLNRF